MFNWCNASRFGIGHFLFDHRDVVWSKWHHEFTVFTIPWRILYSMSVHTKSELVIFIFCEAINKLIKEVFCSIHPSHVLVFGDHRTACVKNKEDACGAG